MQIDGVAAFSRRTGRAELDEHAEGVNMTEFIISFDEKSARGREEVLEEIREAMAEIPGIVTSVEQPIAHLISHMLSGVKAQIGIKLYGVDLDVLRAKGIRQTTLDAFGVRPDAKGWGGVEIPIRDENGNETAIRIRTANNKKLWPPAEDDPRR